jgi:hypothetical protein
MLQEEEIMKKIALFTALLFAITTLVSPQIGMAQDKSKRPSPPASAECKFSDGKTIKVDYSSPRAKGRKIFGAASDKALVPFGEIWRTGANEATTFVTGANVTVGGKDVPAGSYTIFTIPTADAWTLIINKKTGEWGIPYKYEADELARVDMQVSKPAAPVENFTIAFGQAGGKCTLSMEWENTGASVEIAKK